MDSEKEKNRLSDIVLERVGLTGNLLSAPVSHPRNRRWICRVMKGRSVQGK